MYGVLVVESERYGVLQRVLGRSIHSLVLILLYQNALFTDITTAPVAPVAPVTTVTTVTTVLRHSTYSTLFYVVVFILQILQTILLLLHNRRC
jgi:hypothetical protein